MFNYEIANDTCIIELKSEFTIHELKDLKVIHSDLEEKNIYNIVLDMSSVRYIDSSGIGFLVKLLKYSKRNSGELKLYSVTEEVKSILRLVNLYSFFSIIEELDI
ncbi:MAG: STAS domain-containing protein [Fusobacteria bacterium]|nr:STAS domain-containing protein [Fusobacteriota bacterium]